MIGSEDTPVTFVMSDREVDETKVLTGEEMRYLCVGSLDLRDQKACHTSTRALQTLLLNHPTIDVNSKQTCVTLAAKQAYKVACRILQKPVFGQFDRYKHSGNYNVFDVPQGQQMYTSYYFKIQCQHASSASDSDESV